MLKYGFLRETEEQAKKCGIDKKTGMHRTGLDTYLKVIFPDIDDWVHDKLFPKNIRDKYKFGRRRPDYRSESLNLIVEFDGIQHYQSPERCATDIENKYLYEKAGYTVVRIPYFIQLTNQVVKQLFDIEVKEQLFPEGISSLDYGCYPAYLCPAGIKRMANELVNFKEQYDTNKLNMMCQPSDEFVGFLLFQEALYK
jgi:hypothetical protein